MLELIDERLIREGLNPHYAELASRALAGLAIIILALIADLIAKKLILRFATHLISRSQWKWDDILIERKVLKRLAHFAPATVVYLLTPTLLGPHESAVNILSNLMLIYMIILGMLAISAILNAAVEIYRSFEKARQVPIKSFIQLIKIVVFFVGVILITSIVLGKTPLFLISGLGALTAVLMLVFKDTILGFVAGIQLLANRMVARGDWIEMPKQGADGDVLDVTLTTVKVQNWDKTITTIPTYALISESFKNWRGMSQSGGRRIKRSINLDINTIKLCDEKMLERFDQIDLLRNYLNDKRREVTEYNAAHKVNPANPVNGRQLTNIGTFRAYIVAYLQEHPMINRDMTFLVRQLAPSATGLPLEIYIFCKDKAWGNYEAIQADIFDHLLAVVPEFGMRVFQQPSGNDFTRLTAPP